MCRLVRILIIMPPPRRGGGGIKRSSTSVRPSICLSDVAYIGSNSKTKRPRKTKVCTGVPQVTCDSHTDLKVKTQKSRWGRGILWRRPSHTACSTCCRRSHQYPRTVFIFQSYSIGLLLTVLVHVAQVRCNCIEALLPWVLYGELC